MNSTTQTPSTRAESVKPFVVMKVAAAAAALESAPSKSQPDQTHTIARHKKVLHLEIGQPVSAPPQTVALAAINCIADPSVSLAYTSALGIKPLRCALASHYQRRHDIRVAEDNIIVTNGSSAAFVAAFVACFDVGDRVAVAVPGYPCYRNVLQALGVRVVRVPVCADNNWHISVQQLQRVARDGKLHGVIVASPANPTGSVMSGAQLADVARFCERNGVKFISDEIYHGITQTPATCALQVAQGAIVVNSMSKYWCMTGYRIGWIVTRNRQMVHAIERVIQNMNICSTVVSQYAAVAALNDDCYEQLDGHVRSYFSNMTLLLAYLRRAGFVVAAPQGAFYLYADCTLVCEKIGVGGSVELCELLLEESLVAATPGIDFDDIRGEQFVRFCCAGSEEDVRDAGQRIEKWVAARCMRAIQNSTF